MQLKTYLLAALLATSTAALAQQSVANEDSTKKEWIKDIVKVNLTALPLKNISVQYEYVLSKKISLALGLRVMPTTAIPFESLVLEAVGEDDVDMRDLINTSRIGNFAITPEVRFYLGKGYGKGFYIAPYYRYANFSSNTLTLNYSSNGPKRSVNLSGEVSGHTGGVMFGAQWFLGKHVTLDWWILGAHYGIGNGKFIGIPSTPLTPGEQDDVRSTLEGIDIPMVDKEITVNANRVDVKVNGPFGGLRSGILFGYRF